MSRWSKIHEIERLCGRSGRLQSAITSVFFSNKDGHCEYSGVAQEYNRCVKAHGDDELQEWHQRVSYRRAKLKISRQHSAVDLTFENAASFRSDVDGVQVACDRSLDVHLTEKTASCTWNFHVAVGLRPTCFLLHILKQTWLRVGSVHGLAWVGSGLRSTHIQQLVLLRVLE